MRNLNEATLYPGIGAIEGTNLSVGRGTDTPFEQVGAPWIDGVQLAEALNARAHSRRPLLSGPLHAGVEQVRGRGVPGRVHDRDRPRRRCGRCASASRSPPRCSKSVRRQVRPRGQPSAVGLEGQPRAHPGRRGPGGRSPRRGRPARPGGGCCAASTCCIADRLGTTPKGGRMSTAPPPETTMPRVPGQIWLVSLAVVVVSIMAAAAPHAAPNVVGQVASTVNRPLGSATLSRLPATSRPRWP